MGPKTNEWCLYKKRRETERYRGEGDVKTEAEIGEMGLQAKEVQEVGQKLEEARRILPNPGLWREGGPASILLLDFCLQKL